MLQGRRETTVSRHKGQQARNSDSEQPAGREHDRLLEMTFHHNHAMKPGLLDERLGLHAKNSIIQNGQQFDVFPINPGM
jgi:hypothetical protein